MPDATYKTKAPYINPDLFGGGFIPPPEEPKCSDTIKKLNQILDKLNTIEDKQNSKDGYYLKNGIWRKL